MAAIGPGGPVNNKPYSPPVIERNQERIGGKYGAGRSAPVCERIGGVAVEQLAREQFKVATLDMANDLDSIESFADLPLG